MNEPDCHFCTRVTSVGVHEPHTPPGSCAAAIFYNSRYISDLCSQTAALGNRTIFTHIQQNQWAYSGPSSAYLLRVFCPPSGKETHSSIPLTQDGGLLQMPEGCSGKYGPEILPATFKVSTRFRVNTPVHRPFPRLEAEHWRPITASTEVDTAVLQKIKETLGNSTQLKMPLRQYDVTLARLKSDLAKSKLHRIYHSPAFAPALSVSTVVLVVVGVLVAVVVARRWRAGGESGRKGLSRSGSPSASLHPEMLPLQAISGPAGSTPFPTQSGRRPLPAPPVTIRELSEEDLEENRPRSPRRARRTRTRTR